MMFELTTLDNSRYLINFGIFTKEERERILEYWIICNCGYVHSKHLPNHKIEGDVTNSKFYQLISMDIILLVVNLRRNEYHPMQ